MKTPVAVFTYNRPQHLARMLQTLEACKRLPECHVVFYCDGPRRPEDEALVAQNRAVVSAWARRHSADVVLRDENFGLARSVVDGAGALCQQYGRVIVLEDDLLLAPDFLDFQLRALDHYADDPRVMQVVGYIFPFEKNPPPGLLLFPLSSTQGWGTWARAWQQMTFDADAALADLADPARAQAFNLGGIYPYMKMLRQHRQRGNSWGVMFWYSVWRQGGLCVYSRQSLVGNIGFDGSGVNSGAAAHEGRAYTLDPRAGLPAGVPFPSGVDEALWQRYRAYIRRITPQPTLPQRARAWLRQRLRAKENP